MAKKTDRKSPLKNMIEETMKDLRNKEAGFPDDPTLESDADEVTGPERFSKTQKHKDEIVIDSLLSNIAGKQGYFLKLKREMRPNEWMLMTTVENDWRRWADIETEVSNLVKEYTKKSPQKWGTALYRIEISCKGGMRGQTYDPIDLWVNADEEFVSPVGQSMQNTQAVSDPSVAVASQIETLSNLVGMLKDVFPQPTNPADTQKEIASAFKEGMALKVSEGNNSTQMMTAMMTAMMGMVTAVMTKGNENGPRVVNPEDQLSKMLETLKTFGVLGANTNNQTPKTAIDFAKELRELGMDLFKKDDPLESIGKLKQIAGIAAQFMGMQGEGERPSILEKIIDVIGPSIPGMVKDIKETAEKAVAVQQIAGQNIERAKQIGHMPTPSGHGEEKTTHQQMTSGGHEASSMNTHVNAQNNEDTSSPVMNEQVKAFFNQVYESVKTNNRMYYPIIYTSLLQDVHGQQIIQDIANGTGTAKSVIDLLQQYGGDRFKESEFVMRHLVGYTNGFILWVRNMMQPQSTENMNGMGVTQKEFEAECPICHAVFSFATEQEFNNEQDKSCGADINGVKCVGVLLPVVKAS